MANLASFALCTTFSCSLVRRQSHDYYECQSDEALATSFLMVLTLSRWPEPGVNR